MRRAVHIAVAGGGACSARTARLATDVGREVAAAGAILVCGGLGGVMQAAARGAATAGGTVVGILPGYEHARANPWCHVVVPTGLGHARNVLVAASGDALIALPGAEGTASEIALARVLGRPVVVLGGGRLCSSGLVRARTAAEAVRVALARVRSAAAR
jgi:uncharacterized protein (TIGR00725 family)